MKNKNFKAWLRQWDESGFDFTAATAGPAHQEPPKREDPAYRWDHRLLGKLERREIGAFRKLYPVLACVLCAVIIAFLFLTVAHLPAFGSADAPANNEVMERYVEKGMEETGAVNVVAGVILDYRAFDTLGESHVLYTAVTAVLILLLAAGKTE